MTRLVPLWLLAACGPDLPEGWEEAEPIADLTQAQCAGNPYEPHDERVEGSASAGTLSVTYSEAHFRCEQEVEGFWLDDGGLARILVQPIDMDPKIVAGCDCLYDIQLSIATEAAAAELYRRWDNLNDPNDPVLIGAIGQ